MKIDVVRVPSLIRVRWRLRARLALGDWKTALLLDWRHPIAARRRLLELRRRANEDLEQIILFGDGVRSG